MAEINNNKQNQNPNIPPVPPKPQPPKPVPTPPKPLEPELGTKPNANDNTIKAPPKKKPAIKDSKEKIKPTLDIGPIKKKFDFKKLLKPLGIGVAVIFVIGLIYIGYLYYINLTPEEVPEEKIRRTREVDERVVEEDPSSLDNLEELFGNIGDQVEILEKDANFEKELNLGRNDF